MKNFGIDVSHWQGYFNFRTAIAKDKIKFAMIKAGGSDNNRYKDIQFENYYASCKANNLPIGCYYFGGDLDENSARKSAEHFLSVMKGKQFELPVYYDVEAKMLNLSKATLVKVVKAFCETLEKAGYYVGIYASESVLNTKLNDVNLKGYTTWVAKYSKNEPVLSGNREVGMWQFGGEKNYIRSKLINGITVDQDYLLKDFESVIKSKGLNGFSLQSKPVSSYYKAYTGTSTSIVTALKSVGETDTSLAHRKKIALSNGISGYTGTATQNTQMLSLLKQGKLKKG